jgi:hypothetical protein
MSESTKALSAPTVPTLKRLFAVSGNRCAFPKCKQPIVVDETVVGKVCHIKAKEPGGKRYDPTQSPQERHGFDNLVLMCGPHHDVIDDDDTNFTVEVLKQLKLVTREGILSQVKG